MNAFDRAVARVNEIADRDVPDREKVWDYFVAILDTQLADLIRNGELRTSGFTETADLLAEAATPYAEPVLPEGAYGAVEVVATP